MFCHKTATCILLLLIPFSSQQNLRNTTGFNLGWLFHYGDASGAEATSLDDSNWRALSIPHDWAIEGPSPPSNPFSESAATTGRGGYVPSGIGWYRKHFSLASPSNGQKVYVEFDGIMENASVYVNGKLIGTHPYGYTSLRYDITSAVSFTDANVLSVKTDTSKQPDERYYAGGGIYRDVRIITTNPIHIDQYGLFVTTPLVSTTTATIQAQTTVVNEGNTAENISVQGMLIDPTGRAALPIVSTPQTIAAGARGIFAFNMTVSNPQLWDLASPHLYSLAATVSAGGVAVDNSSTTVGIRSIAFSATTGMSLNGQNVKFKGVCLHQEYHALGLAAPKRAMQRRLAQLKTLGVNSIRIAHNPPSPAFLDLTDSMGFLVLDEFFDVWTAHKYTDNGDYASYFSQGATIPTGGPAVPDSTGSVPWYQVDIANTVSRDRNHPSVALYSVGNEIHDSITKRTPLLIKMKAIINALDPSRLVTQALLQPSSSGDVTGDTRTILDVFGGNYHTDDVLTAMAMSPVRAGLMTEQTTDTSQWNAIKSNAALTGLFLWTGVDYLGEANGEWPTVGADFGLMDAVGTVKALGYSWQKVWGAASTTSPATGTTANRITLTPEQTVVSSDVNDIAYVKASIVDAPGRLVLDSAASIKFAVSGPGVIIAVDSGSQRAETFRGDTRTAYQGIAYVLIRATGVGNISVTATTSGLAGDTAALTGTTAQLIL